MSIVTKTFALATGIAVAVTLDWLLYEGIRSPKVFHVDCDAGEHLPNFKPGDTVYVKGVCK